LLLFCLLTFSQMDGSYLLLFKICCTVFSCFCQLLGVKLYILSLLWKYLIATALCSPGWHESFGIIVSVVVGFLYISNRRSSWSLFIVMSRKLILLFSSSSNVKFIFTTRLLSSVSRLRMLVSTSL
jgi:hypothetical protein